MFTCITAATDNGYLRWKNSSGHDFEFGPTAMVGSTGIVGDFSLKLTHSESIFRAHIYISTATLNSAVEETTINCTDGVIPRGRTVQIRSEF